ncbi:MAG: hypothetical protein LRY43_02670, partial [Gammaproteobacteria bacterium]|nr:hypothetical protein [Gammaproteobacteria bacterium]
MLISLFVTAGSVATASSDVTSTPDTVAYHYTDPNSTSPSYAAVGRPIVSETDTLTLDNRLLGLQGPVSVSGSYTSNYGY